MNGWGYDTPPAHRNAYRNALSNSKNILCKEEINSPGT
jgi:hypothetical protein